MTQPEKQDPPPARVPSSDPDLERARLLLDTLECWDGFGKRKGDARKVAESLRESREAAEARATRAEAKLERAEALLFEVARGGGYGLPIGTAERIDEWRQENCKHKERSLSGAGYICDDCGHRIPNEDP